MHFRDTSDKWLEAQQRTKQGREKSERKVVD